MQLQLDSRYKAVADFIAEASDDALPPKVQAHLCRLGTVLVCGYIERSIEIVVIERLTNRAQPIVLNFIRSYFRYGRNLDASAISQLLIRFDNSWQSDFDDFIAANPKVKELVGSCYGLRNAIAHGNTANVSLLRLNELLAAAKDLVDSVVHATRPGRR